MEHYESCFLYLDSFHVTVWNCRFPPRRQPDWFLGVHRSVLRPQCDVCSWLFIHRTLSLIVLAAHSTFVLWWKQSLFGAAAKAIVCYCCTLQPTGMQYTVQTTTVYATACAPLSSLLSQWVEWYSYKHCLSTIKCFLIVDHVCSSGMCTFLCLFCHIINPTT